MSSILRAMNRKAKRTDCRTKLHIAAAKQRENEVVAKVTQEVTRKIKPGIEATTWSKLLILVLAFEHIDRKHTGKWLRKWLWEFDDFSNAFQDSGAQCSELIQILKDECDFDIEAEYAEIVKQAEAKEKARLLPSTSGK